jgi:CubicO group peptidase (beta-lactamase class C family)
MGRARRWILAGLAWAAALACPGAAPATLGALEALIQAERQIDRGGFGTTLFTAKGPEWSYTTGAGDPRRIPFGPDTPLMAGELSGRIVILAAVRMADRGRLDLDRPLGAYWPGLEHDTSPHLARLSQLPVRALAAESTGRVDAIPCLVPGYVPGRHLLPALGARAERFPSGFRQSWSCGMNDLLALLLERLDRRPWAQVVRDEALNPLGMRGSAWVTPVQGARTVSFYFPEGTPYDPRLVESLLPPLAPSLSLRTTLGDLAACGRALLAADGGEPGAPLSAKAARAVLAPAIPGQLDRQGFESGLGWNLTDYRLAYLGRVAWAFGAGGTHQVLVMLLPDRGLGVVLAQTWQDPGGLYDLKRIARALLQTWTEREQGLPRPEFQVPPVIPPVPPADRAAPGLYASLGGVAELDWDGDQLALSIRGGFGQFVWAGPGRFRPAADNEFAQVDLAGNTLTVAWRSGARARLERVPDPGPGLALEPGSFPVEAPDSVQSRGTALLDRRRGHWILTGDDARSYLLLPDPGQGARILCDEASALYGCRVAKDSQGVLHIRAPAAGPSHGSIP